LDYLGEASIGRTGLSRDPSGGEEFPWFGAGCGDLDLIGEQRPQSLAREPRLAVLRPTGDTGHPT